MKTLADFKKLCVPGAQFVRHLYAVDLDGNPVRDRVCTVAKVQSKDVVFLHPNAENTPENITACAARPGALGSWSAFPPASRCKIEGAAIVFHDQLGRPYVSYAPVIPY
jgi:hypothetical protein